MNEIIANIFSLIGASLLAYSTFSKKKENMLLIQTGDTFFNALGNFFIGSYSGMSTNLISMIRNILNAKNKNNKYINFIIVMMITIIGVMINTKGIIGIFPVIASIQYTISSYVKKTAQDLRYALIINLGIWFIHDFYMLLYPAMTIDILIIFITIINIYKNNKINNYN